jgi:hypothetical protein
MTAPSAREEGRSVLKAIDAFYGGVAGCGMSVAAGVPEQGKLWFQLFEGDVLVVMGIRL